MAVLDFPASPLTGDKYPVPAVAGQPQYTYDGVKWTTVGAQISNAAPASALPLMDQATALVGTATKYAREDHVHPKIAAAPFDALAYSGMQINGSMEVSQELGTSGAVTNYYICDGWRSYRAGTSAISCAQVLYTMQPGFPYTLGVSVTTAQASLGASDVVQVYQCIEGYRIARLGWGNASAQPITLGFWTQHHRAGLYSGIITNAAQTDSYAFTYTQNVSDVPQYNVVTIPGAKTGVWKTDNTVGMNVVFALACGTGLMAPSANAWVGGPFNAAPGQINAVAATTDQFRITGVVVLPGIVAPTAAQSPLIMRPYDQELVTCQRYWQSGYAGLSGYQTAGISAQVISSLAVRMRAVATFTFSGVLQGNCTGGAIGAWGDPSAYYISTGPATATGALSFSAAFQADARL